ncbi:MAG: acetolactate synthase [Candidatus Dormibacteraeota bacterium]|nr:acetolactate synthase [Candidatus Dormibacteraeota bacterium]
MAVASTGNAGELIALGLQAAGTSHLFTLNGAHIWPLLTGSVEHGIRVIDTRHEQTATFAAEGWSKVTRQCGVAAVTAGPGVTNSVSAVAAAQANDSPLLLIGGRAPQARWGMGSLQELDHPAFLRSLTKSASTLHSASDAYAVTSDAIALALAPRTGPVFFDVPFDTMLGTEDLPEKGPAPVPRGGAAPDPDQVGLAAAQLREARRPVIVAGTGVWWAHGEAALIRLAEAVDAPVYTNGLARGMLSPGHRLHRSRSRSSGVGEADLVILVGVPLDFRLNWGLPPLVNDQARIVYIDVDDFRKHRPPAAALYGDIALALDALAEAARDTPRHPDWLQQLATVEEAARERDRTLHEAGTHPIHPARLIAEVARVLDPDAIVVGDGGDFVSFAGRLIERPGPGLFLDPGPFGCLGSGPGYAMAAKLAHPDRQVVLLSGDGAFGFGAIEFDTLVRHRINVVCVIGNNGIWATEKHPMQQFVGTAIATDLRPGTRYDRMVDALGGHGELVEQTRDVAPALHRALDAGVPSCINVLTDPGAEYPRSSVLM